MTATTDSALRPDADLPGEPPQRRSRRRLVTVLVAAGLVLVALVVWVVWFSPLLGVRTVEVRGVHQLTPAQVEQAAQVPHGQPLLRLDTAAIAGRVDRLPVVESAHVTTSLPSTVIITVVERTPVGWLRVGGSSGHDVLVDRTGTRYESVHRRPARLPRIVLPVGADRATTAAVAQVAAVLPAKLLPHVRSIQALDPNAITLLLRSDRVVHWGSSADSTAKAEVLPPLIHSGAATIDVSDPDHPFTH